MKQLEIELLFSNLGYTLISNYQNRETPVTYICFKGHVHKLSAKHLQENRKCLYCYHERLRGTGNPNYNPYLTDADRSRNGIKQWRRKVLVRDGFCCQICFTFDVLQVHHLNCFRDHPDLRTEVSNGITLCEECHKKFHLTYGFGGNTREQFETYLSERKNASCITVGNSLHSPESTKYTK